MSEYGNFEGFGGSITSPEDMFYSPNYPSGGTGSIDRPDLYPPGGTDPQQTPEDRRAELDEKLANDPFYNNLGSDGARELYRQYIYEGTTVGGGGWWNNVFQGNDPSRDFRTPGMPDSTPIDAEDFATIGASLEAQRIAAGATIEEFYGSSGIPDYFTNAGIPVGGVDPTTVPLSPEALQKIETGYESSEVREQNSAALESLINDTFASSGAGTLPTTADAPLPAWLQSILDTIKGLKDEWPPKLPGLTVTYDPREGVYATVLIPIPGLPEWIQGDGMRIPITENGQFVLDDVIVEQVQGIGQKIQDFPQKIADGVSDVVEQAVEAGQKIAKIYTDGEGNILGDIVDSAGVVIDILKIPAGIFIDEENSSGATDFLLKGGLLLGGLSVLRDLFEGKKDSPTVDTGGEDTSGVVGVTGGTDDNTTEGTDLFSGFGASIDKPKQTKVEDVFTGYGVSLNETTGDSTPDNPLTGTITTPDIKKSEPDNPLTGTGTTTSDAFTGTSGGGNPFMSVPLRRRAPPVEEDEDDPFEPFYFGDFENIYNPVDLIMNPKAREQFGGVGIASLAVRDLVLSRQNLDRIQKEAENIGRFPTVNVAKGGLVPPSFPDKLRRIMRDN